MTIAQCDESVVRLRDSAAQIEDGYLVVLERVSIESSNALKSTNALMFAITATSAAAGTVIDTGADAKAVMKSGPCIVPHETLQDQQVGQTSLFHGSIAIVQRGSEVPRFLNI